jgi:exosortase/archaeosortase family protein
VPWRWPVAFGLLALLALVAAFGWQYLTAETVISSWIIGVFTRVPMNTIAGSHLIVVDGAQPDGFALTLTAECSTLPIVLAFITVSMVFAGTGKIPVQRIGRGMVWASVVTVTLNLLRLGCIGYFTHRWGIEGGFGFSHLYFGSVCTVLGITAGMVLYGWLLVKRGKPVAAAAGGSEGTP